MSSENTKTTANEQQQPKKKKGSLLKKLFIALVGVVAIIAIVWIFFLPAIITSQVKNRTGFDLKIQHLSVNPFTATVAIDGLVLTNPANEFKTSSFLSLQALHLDVQLFSLFKDQLVVNNATLDLPSVTLVRRAKDVSNAELFANRLSGGPSTGTKPSTPSEPSKPLNFLIKKMDINLGKVVVANEPESGTPTTQEYNINYKHTYENITDPKQFITADLAKSMLNIGSQLTNLIPGKLGSGIDSVLKGGINVLDNPSESLNNAAKGLLDKLVPPKK